LAIDLEYLMQLAIDRAWHYQGLTYPNPAVGALVLYRGEIVAIEAHQRAGSSHAEVLALLSAYESISDIKIEFDRFDAFKAHDFLINLPNGFFKESIIFVTLEPCNHSGKTLSCASLLEVLKLQKVVIAIDDPIDGHGGGARRLEDIGIDVERGVCEDRAKELIEPFMIWQSRAFVLFKLAQTTNGRIGGGYLSSKESLIHVHQMRAVCDSLLIGGSTIRVDRPRLDCRYIDAKAPDIKIYSKRDHFDETIALFDIEDRDVEVINNLEFLKKPSFVIVEGGESMLKAMNDKIDWLLVYQTPKLSTHSQSYSIDRDLEFLYIDRKGVDIMIWQKYI